MKAMSDEAASPVPDAVPGPDPARTLSSAQLAAALTPPRKVRVVQKWADEGAPHTAAKGRGGKKLLWNLAETRAWLERQGRRSDRTDRLFMPPAPVAGAGAAPLGGVTEVVDVQAMTARMNRLLTEVMDARPKDGMSVAQMGQWSAAIKNVSHELRQLREELVAVEEREHKVIPRERAEAWLAGLVGLFRGGLEACVTRVPAEVALSAGEPLARQAEAVRPLIAAAVRREADLVLESLARRLEQHEGELAAVAGVKNLSGGAL